MRIWMETSLNSFPFSIIAGTTCVAVSAEYVESCKTPWCHQSLFGSDSKGKTRPPGKQSRMGGGKKKRCLWSLSKWGAFAHLGRRGENEWEASCEADRHTCRWIIWQQGQVPHHCRSHVQHSHPPRGRSVDSIHLHPKCYFADQMGVLQQQCSVVLRHMSG